MELQFKDLGGAYLGLANPATNQIRIDDDAARMGWSVESVQGSRFSSQRAGFSGQWSVVGSPLGDDSSSFLNPEPRTRNPGIDLLTVVMHELGHLLGYEHSEDGLMAPVLSASSSRIPDLGSHPDGVFADMEWDSSAEPSSVLLASHDGEVPKTAAVKSSDERTHVRAPRPSRLQRYERELDDWFTQLAAAERVNL